MQEKRNAIEKIEQLLTRIDFSKIPMFNYVVVKRIDRIREILMSFHSQWNDVIR